jgi:hypothetical protein
MTHAQPDGPRQKRKKNRQRRRWLQGRALAGILAGTAIVVLALFNPTVDLYTEGALDWLPGGKRFTVEVERNPDQINSPTGPVGGSYLTDKPIQDVGEPPQEGRSCEGRYLWARQMGAIDADSTLVRVTVEGRSDRPIQLKELKVNVLERRAPSTGTHITCPGRGERPEIRAVSVTLDQLQPKATTSNQDGTPIPFLFNLTRGQLEVFDITALAPDCECTWEAVLFVQVSGRTHQQTIRDSDGQPFVTSASVNARSYERDQNRWVARGDPGDAPAALPPAEAFPPLVDPCSLVNDAFAGEALGAATTRRQSAPPYLGSGVAEVITEATCSYVSSAPPPPTLPPGGAVSDGVNILITGAETEAAAAREAEGRLTRYAPGKATVALSSPAGAVDAGNGVIQAVVGRRIVTIQVTQAGTDGSRAALALAERALANLAAAQVGD